jgi:hypothetical protein
MEKYNIFGAYEDKKLSEGNRKLFGQIEVNDKGNFEGIINEYLGIDQLIKGQFIKEGNRVKFVFLKNPKTENLSNIIYELSKKNDGNLSGKYIGEWQKLPYKIDYNKESNFFTARIDLNPNKIGSLTEIVVYQ